MGKKYIIELEDKPFHKRNGDFLYRVKGFNSLVFDMTGVGKLMPYTEPDLEQVRKGAYEKGYRRALADVREEHVCQTCVYFERDENEEPCVRCPRNFLDQYTPKQERDAEIRVGDEVRNGKNGWTAVVVRIRDDDCLTLMDDKGAIADGYEITKFVKTGRHFPEIAAVLEKMRKE